MEFHSIATIFPLMSEQESAALAEDILKNGLREPILTFNNQIVDGRNRYLTCKKLGIEPRYIEWDGKGSLLDLVISVNLNRRHLNETQRETIAAKLATMRQGERTDLGPSAILQKVGQADAAKIMHVGERNVAKAKKVLETGTPELVSTIETGNIRVNQAEKIAIKPKSFQRKVVRKLKAGIKPMEAMRQVVGESYAKKKLVAGGKKYRVVYCDCPWSYWNTSADYQTAARDHYPTMELEEICAMPVKELVEDNAVLFLWVTSPMLKKSFEVISAFGFEYKASFVWDKVKHNLGRYNSVRHEFLLVGTRGSCLPDVHKLFDSVQSIERGEHSAKPEEFRAIIDTIYPHGNRIELFARKTAKGWDNFGNDVS